MDEHGFALEPLERLREIAKNPLYAIELGKAAEHIACADLILHGYRAFLSDQGLPYDIVVDIAGRLIRVQVKACAFARNVNGQGKAPRLAYSFNVRRRGKNSQRRLTEEHCDIVACCALDIRRVAYFPIGACGQTMDIMPPGAVFQGRYKRRRIASIDGYPFNAALI